MRDFCGGANGGTKYTDSTYPVVKAIFQHKIQSKNKKYIYMYVQKKTKQNSVIPDSSQDHTNITLVLALFIQQKVIGPYSSCSADLDFLLI